MRLTTLTIACYLMGSAAHAFAGDDTSGLASRLKEKYPGTTFGSVDSTPLPGLYQVQMGRNLVYTDASGRYFVFGNIWDMEQQKDLSADKRNEINRIPWASLPLNHAIKIVRGNGRRTVAVFTDPDCPYCQRLEQEMAQIDDVTIHLFLYPIAQLHPGAPEKAESVWCAENPAKAWADLMLHGRAPGAKRCGAPLDEIQKLVRNLGVRGTPTLISADGRVMAGAASRDHLTSWLDAARP